MYYNYGGGFDDKLTNQVVYVPVPLVPGKGSPVVLQVLSLFLQGRLGHQLGQVGEQTGHPEKVVNPSIDQRKSRNQSKYESPSPRAPGSPAGQVGEYPGHKTEVNQSISQ